ncbi:hypothetical protein EVAR_30853_1 [Eumeta japonica]|uniref:Uncharacterized protein n=1 Tax=Eumeta variegata TaxID=151549 RepID=A0A4C1XRW1_EUMVA|nr:hypothetical protein EVAR_30853_1 [Eumeta japonica]
MHYSSAELTFTSPQFELPLQVGPRSAYGPSRRALDKVSYNFYGAKIYNASVKIRFLLSDENVARKQNTFEITDRAVLRPQTESLNVIMTSVMITFRDSEQCPCSISLRSAWCVDVDLT